jgi:glucose/arabinose dehydrogenase
VLAIAGCGSSHKSGSGLVSIGAGLHGEPGLKATVYARGLPTVAAFAFDQDGRLWAAAAGLSGHAHDGVYVIDGAGARPQRVIGGLDDPLGLAWQGNTLYVASVGKVTAYSKFTGDRFASSKTIVDGPVKRGENNGLVLGRDGRLTMGITATCDHCTPIAPQDGAIVSFKPNGSDLKVYASQIRAPVGLAFYPGTSDLFASMNQRNDLGPRTTGDWLAFVPRGSNWGFPGCYGQAGAACAGVPKPLATLDKHAAAGPVVFTAGTLAGPGVPGLAALVTEWQTSKVARVAVTKTRGAYKGATATWLTGVRNPFALALAPGGAVIVGDWGTGTIYRIAPAGLPQTGKLGVR